MPVEGVDVLVSNRDVEGKTLVDLVSMPQTRGVFLQKIVRGASDLMTLAGRTQDTTNAVKLLGVPDRATDVVARAWCAIKRRARCRRSATP